MCIFGTLHIVLTPPATFGYLPDWLRSTDKWPVLFTQIMR